MTLAWKTWRETRARFALSTLALGWFSSAFVVMRPAIQYTARKPFGQAIVDAIYGGGVRNIFVLFVIALGLGGLREESARGCAPFTLALPMTRAHLVGIRAAVGFAEVLALSLTPTAAVLGISPFVGETFSAVEALRYSLQWAATGSALFAVAFLLSAWFAAAYAALTASILVLASYGLILSVPAVRAVPSLNLLSLMSAGHPSASRLAVAFVFAWTTIAAAAYATERQDF